VFFHYLKGKITTLMGVKIFVFAKNGVSLHRKDDWLVDTLLKRSSGFPRFPFKKIQPFLFFSAL
jgi:hypothetical protein